MRFDFDRKVNREGLDSIKLLHTPDPVTESGHLTMWGAEFDFPTAPFVADAVAEWAARGLYSYTSLTDDFLETVCRWMKMQRDWEIHSEWIVPTYGISMSLAAAIRALTGNEAGIISFEPGYNNYWQAVELCGRRRIGCRLVFDGEKYSINWDELEMLASETGNEMIVLCNPHNPTGKVFTAAEVERIAEIAVRHDLLIFSDEIFAECIYPDFAEGRVVTVDQVNSDARVITATSLGKWLSFTGTNQANMIIRDEEVRKRFTEERDKGFYGSMNPMMVPAYRAAYTKEGQQWISELMEYIKGNYELVCEYFKRIQGFRAVHPEGTYILWIDATEFSGDEARLNKFLIEQAHFHADMGTQYFGEPGFFRINLALPRAELEKNLKSLEAAAGKGLVL